jgi:predicted dehydrogenase
MRLRVGLVGLGDAWESRHRPALLALRDRFEVRAVFSEVAKRAEQAAAEFNAAAVDSFRVLTRRDDVDAILMLSPQWFGPLPILASCETGKAVYCAAALDIDPQQAREIRQRVEEAGIAFMAEFPRRHAPATLRLKELIATRLGKPRLLFCHERLLVPEKPNGAVYGRHWPLAMRDLMELVDWCRYVVGDEPTSVVGVRHGISGNPADDDYQMMSLDFSKNAVPGEGPIAQISCGRYMPATWRDAIYFRPPSSLQVCCERGIAFIDLPSKIVWFDEAGQHVESLDSERPVGEQLLNMFHRAVTSLVRKANDLDDAYRALSAVLAAQTSSLEGRRMKLEL